MIRIRENKEQEFERRHAHTIRDNGGEFCLFLKRTEDFPIKPCKINLYGYGARHTIYGGIGSSNVNVRNVYSIEDGLKEEGFIIRSNDWLDGFDKKLQDFFLECKKKNEETDPSNYEYIIAPYLNTIWYEGNLDGDGDVNIYVISRTSSESIDRRNEKGDYLLFDQEKKDILYLSSLKKKFLLILNTCGPVDLSEVVGSVDNILLVSLLGGEVGHIVSDVITGKQNPSGKLTSTWARFIDHPSSKTFGNKNEVDYIEGKYVGYRYFDTFKKKPIFSFGYGLSYTDFSFKVNSMSIENNTLRINCIVKNIGKMQGKEVLECYYRKVNGKIGRQLIGFKKTEVIQPGEEKECVLDINLLYLMEFNKEKKGNYIEKGIYQIYIGNSLDSSICYLDILVKEDYLIEKTRNINTSNIDELVYTGTIGRDSSYFSPIEYIPVVIEKEEKTKYISKYASTLSNEELVKVCLGTGWNMEMYLGYFGENKGTPGFAAGTYYTKDIPPLLLTDGPNGIRISPISKTTKDGKVLDYGAFSYPKRDIDIEQDEDTFYQYTTALPIETAVAQSFNTDLIQKLGVIIGEELEVFDLDVILGPGINIHRNPLCGRDFEYYSEDPVLSGICGGYLIKGVQSIPNKYATVKHFFVNNQETDRFFSSSNVTEKTLRDIYLRGFRICIEIGDPKCLMTSYNLYNGTHTVCSDVVQEVLRGEWKYDGLVMSDWNSTGGYGTGEKYGPGSPRESIKRKNDVLMPGMESDRVDILDGLKSGDITREELLECASRVLRYKEKME